MKTHSTKTNGHKTTTQAAHENEEDAVEKTEEMPAQTGKKAGAKGAVIQDGASAATVTTPATASDVAVAAELAPGSVGLLKRPVSPVLIAQFANPQMQKDLAPITSDLAAFEGCDVEEYLAMANEGANLLGVAERIVNSLGRVHQRLVFINKNLLGFQTSLGNAAAAAPAKSDVAKGLAAFSSLRSAAKATRKTTRTRNATKQEKVTKADAAPKSQPAPSPKAGNGSNGAAD